MAKKNKNKKAAHVEQNFDQRTNRNEPQFKTRSFLASIRDRFTNDFDESVSINADIRAGLSALRNRTRSAAINNSYVRRYLKLIRVNVVGPDGIQLSVQGTNLDGKFDPISTTIESHFWRWATPQNCSTNGRFDFRKAQEIVIESVARDGEALVMLRRGAEFGPYNFQLQILDADHLDENYNVILSNGNQVIQGVEVNSYGKPIAYWIWKNNPADATFGVGEASNSRIRVEAKDILHIYDPERASQVRGFPWLTSSLLPLHQIEEFNKSIAINARVAANKQIFYKQGDMPITDEAGYQADDLGNVTFESTPGANEILPYGWDVVQMDWKVPTDSVESYQTTVLRGAAVGLGINYNSLAGDLSNVNYSSARFGGLEDQAQYRSMQYWFINAFVKPVYEAWLDMQLLTNSWGLNIPIDKFTKFANVNYRPRSYQSVDPVKDINADIVALKNNLTSYTAVIEKRGGDPEATLRQIAKDRALMESLGITPKDVIDTMIAEQNLNSDGTSGTDGSV